MPIACNGRGDYQERHDADRSRQSDPVPDADRAHPAVACGCDRGPAADRPLSIGDGAGRLPAGRHRQDHVHPRAECVAVDVRLGRDEPGGTGHAGVAASAGGCGREGRRPDRRRLYVSCAGHGLAVGAADVGHLLGMGCAADVGADPVSDVSRPDRAVARGGGSLAGGARRRDPDAGRRDQPADHQVLGRLVEYAASAGLGDADRRAHARSRLPDTTSGDGNRVFAAVRHAAPGGDAQRDFAPPGAGACRSCKPASQRPESDAARSLRAVHRDILSAGDGRGADPDRLDRDRLSPSESAAARARGRRRRSGAPGAARRTSDERAGNIQTVAARAGPG